MAMRTNIQDVQQIIGRFLYSDLLFIEWGVRPCGRFPITVYLRKSEASIVSPVLVPFQFNFIVLLCLFVPLLHHTAVVMRQYSTPPACSHSSDHCFLSCNLDSRQIIATGDCIKRIICIYLVTTLGLYLLNILRNAIMEKHEDNCTWMKNVKNKHLFNKNCITLLCVV